MALEDDITAYLRSFPDKKAREMAAALRADRSEINAILYRSLGKRFQVDAEYRWSLMASVAPISNIPVNPPAPQLPAPSAVADPPQSEVLKARRTIARLKRGVPPIDAIDSLAIGMQRITQQVDRLLSDAPTPRWFAVTGEYGEGKSFFRAFSCQRALDAGFAVASLDVNKDEGALHHPQRHLAVVLQSLQSPLEPFVGHQGLATMFRHWLAHSDAQEIRRVLNVLRKVQPDMPIGRDPADFETIIDGLFSNSADGDGANNHHGNGNPVLYDQKGFMYRQFGASGVVYRSVVAQTEWRYYGEADSWKRLTANGTTQSVAAPESADSAIRAINVFSLHRLLRFLSAEDLIGKASYGRFQAAFRLQLINKWLLLTGHQGLFLFIDELDNVVRQIHGKAHPACFRTLGWYCSNKATPTLRIAFATTPEVMSLLDGGYRDLYSESLYEQKSVIAEEYDTYNRWNKEAAEFSRQGWAKCVTLNYAQRVDLFHRIAELYEVAWGNTVIPQVHEIERMARSSDFNTTRRWVRACIQLLEICHQHQETA